MSFPYLYKESDKLTTHSLLVRYSYDMPESNILSVFDIMKSTSYIHDSYHEVNEKYINMTNRNIVAPTEWKNPNQILNMTTRVLTYRYIEHMAV